MTLSYCGWETEGVMNSSCSTARPTMMDNSLKPLFHCLKIISGVRHAAEEIVSQILRAAFSRKIDDIEKTLTISIAATSGNTLRIVEGNLAAFSTADDGIFR